MWRIVLGELLHRRGRTLALLAGIAVATTSFTVLTGAASTQRLDVRGEVSRSFRTAYDVLVRPRGSRTELERRTGRVQPNFLSGLFGGISRKQYRTVGELPGIEVAAPVANVGYVMPSTLVPIDLTRTLDAPGDRTLARARVRWSSERGLSSSQDHSSYVFVTRRNVRQARYEAGINTRPLSRYYREFASLTEVLPGGRSVKLCPELDSVENQAPSPWSRLRRAWVDCWSPKGWRAGPYWANENVPQLPAGRLGSKLEWAFPMLLTAIDPVQEARLTGLDRALVNGRYLSPDDAARPSKRWPGGLKLHSIPVLAASETLLDAEAEVIAERLPTRVANAFHRAPPTPTAHMRWLDAQRGGKVIERVHVDAQEAYERLLADMALPPGGDESNPIVGKYWTVGPTRYEERAGSLVPRQVEVPDFNMWFDALEDESATKVAKEVLDRQFRALAPHDSNWRGDGTRVLADAGSLKLVGQFDVARLRSFSAESALPLETYAPTRLEPRDEASAEALGGRPLPPSPNLGGYVTQPPTLLTTLRGAAPLLDSAWYHEPNPKGPISAIRVRVAGVRGPDAVSRERIRQAAQRIASATGLDVDVTVGASPSPQAVDLPAGRFGRPALALEEPWVRKGVATTILRAVDRKSVVMLALILVVCALFVANAASAAVRARRTELGVLACLGWPTPRLFALVLSEVGLIGLVAGVLGGVLALPIATLADLEASPARAAVAVPAAVLLAVLAGLWPAARAARAAPIAAVRPAVVAVRARRRIRRVSGLAVTDLLRVPGRALLGAASVAIGVAALTLLLAATVAFNDRLVGTLLGDAVAVEARGTDYVAVAAMVLLGAASVADVLFLNLRERAGEFATLRATGWSEGAMTRLVGYQGLLIGAAGSITGAGLGIAGIGRFTDAVPAELLATAAIAAGVGTTLAGLAALAPAAALRRLAPVPLLAAD
jgi:putative ABC transport system permease protein